MKTKLIKFQSASTSFAALALSTLFLMSSSAVIAKEKPKKPDLTKYPCLSYTEECGSMPPPPIEQVEWNGPMGDAIEGKTLAFTTSKGNCLACHAINGGTQGGNIGPSLMNYGSRGVPKTYTYQRLHDTRLYNPDAHMPIFGVTGVLTDEEIRHIMAFLYSLDD